MKVTMQYIPKWLQMQLVEAALDQPAPTASLQTVLNKALDLGKHPSKLIGTDFILVK